MERFFGGNPLSVILRLLVLSIIVGVVLSALDITPDNFLYSIRLLLRRIYELGLTPIEWLLPYLMLGAMVVVPIWLITRMFGLFGGRGGDERDSRK